MGGIMSTRWDGHARRRTVEEMGRVLFVSNLRPLFAASTGATARLTWADGFSLAFTLRDEDNGPDGELGPRLEIGDPADPAALKGALIVLDRIPQPFGGVRWWLYCPGCGQKRRALYMLAPRAGGSSGGYSGNTWGVSWRCRECARLAYRSQRLMPLPRIAQRAAKIGLHVGGTGGHWWPGATDPPRPRGMHRTTYARHRAALEAAREEYNAAWLQGAVRFLNRVTK